MRKTLWSRLIVCFLISAIAVFIFLNTYGVALLENRLKRDQINLLYKQSSLIANAYRGNFLEEDSTMEYLASQFTPIDTYLNIRVWIVNRDGKIIADSSNINSPPDRNINDIDPEFLSKTLSENTTLPRLLNEPMLSVIRRIDYNFQLRGYIVLHSPMEEIHSRATIYFDVINICFLLFFPLLLLIFLYIYYIIIFKKMLLYKLFSL